MKRIVFLIFLSISYIVSAQGQEELLRFDYNIPSPFSADYDSYVKNILENKIKGCQYLIVSWLNVDAHLEEVHETV